RENNIKVTSLNSRMRYPQIFINHSGNLFPYLSKRNLSALDKGFLLRKKAKDSYVCIDYKII
ncbi:hypothetical protein, partial [Tetragenococcus halophilus]|uniref:hypothetical protein n=1 Tax=Tetragenococcus halophilus TaxID=51669 RepID=UPI001CA5E351